MDAAHAQYSALSNVILTNPERVNLQGKMCDWNRISMHSNVK